MFKVHLKQKSAPAFSKGLFGKTQEGEGLGEGIFFLLSLRRPPLFFRFSTVSRKLAYPELPIFHLFV